MIHKDIKDFGGLYRAAFAEQDPEQKQMLLRQVERAIEAWEQTLQNWAAPESASTPPNEPKQPQRPLAPAA